jgi:hypothetical protein
MLENIIKILLSIPLISATIFSSLLVVRLWNTQIDLPKTMSLWLGEQLSLSNWIATRDSYSIYQNGNLVGKVEVNPTIEGNKITFPRVLYVSAMDEKQPIEYQRFKCTKVSVGGTVQVQGMSSASWYENLQCEII